MNKYYSVSIDVRKPDGSFLEVKCDGLKEFGEVQELFEETLEKIEPVGDCNECGSDHDPYECPKL